MTPRSLSRFRAFLQAGAVLAAGLLVVTQPWTVRRREGPFRRAMWFWHQPFEMTSAEVDLLRRSRVERLYILAATVAGGPSGQAVLRPARRFRSLPPVPWVAVVRVDGGALRALLAPEGATRAAGLLHRFPPEGAEGVQWDMDVPTRRLGDYCRFLRDYRRVLPRGARLAVTALPDWVRSPAYAELCRVVDELSPQVYGNHWPAAGERPPTLWETRDLIRFAQQASPGPAATWLGLPAYGRCFLRDARGRVLGLRHDLDPGPMLGDIAWTPRAAETRRGRLERRGELLALEDTYALRAELPAIAGPVDVPPGGELWFQWPRPSALQTAERRLAELRLPGLEGVCYFRWPAPGEPLAIPPASYLDPARVPPAPGGSERRGVLLEGQWLAGECRLRVMNPGPEAPVLGEGLLIEVEAVGHRIEPADPAYWIDWRLGEERVSPLRADRARFSRPFLQPGERWEICRVRPAPGKPVRAVAIWLDGEGRRRREERQWSLGDAGGAGAAVGAQGR